MSHSAKHWRAHHLRRQIAHHHAKHGGHRFALGLELGLWLPLAAVIFLTVGTMAVFALVKTGSSGRQLAQGTPYDCWFADNGKVGCDGNMCMECINGSGVGLPPIACSGLSCGGSIDKPTPTPTSKPKPGVTLTPTPTPTPTSSLFPPRPSLTPTKVSTRGIFPPVPSGEIQRMPSVVRTPTPRFTFSKTPVEAALKIFSGKPNGARCEENKDCQSKQCVANDYGNYCGTLAPPCQPGQLRCSLQGRGNTAQSCNNNGYWETRENCQGGCQEGTCVAKVCTPNQAVCDQNNRRVCASDGMSWKVESCAGSMVCSAGACVSEAIPQCNLGSACSTEGDYCTTTDQQKFRCVDRQWQSLFAGQKVTVVGCSQQKAGLYLAGLSDAAELIAGVDKITLECLSQSAFSALPSVSTPTACRLDTKAPAGSVKFLCDANAATPAIAHSARHEAAKAWALKNGFVGGVVPSYSEVIGCRRQNLAVGVGYVFAEEQPVSAIGRKDCAEAFAEAVALYLEEPCLLKAKFPIQYRWLSSMESPFKGVARCDK